MSPARLTMEYIGAEIGKEGYALISTEYKNCMSYIEVMCPEGHIYRTKWNKFQQKRRCNVCNKNRKKTLAEVKESVKKFGYTVLNTEYVNCCADLVVSCKQGHIYTTSWDKFRAGYRCVMCTGKFRKTFGYIKAYIEDFQYSVISEEKDFINTRSVITALCNNGHECRIRWGDFSRGVRCSGCGGTKKKTFGFVLDKVTSAGYVLVSAKYLNSESNLKVVCQKGHVFTTTYHRFKDGSRCPKCSRSSISEASQVWLDSLGVPQDIREKTIVTTGGNRYKADAFDKDTNIVYEYFGRFWHGHPEYYAPEKINPVCNKTFGDLYQATVLKLENLQNDGYFVIYTWG